MYEITEEQLEKLREILNNLDSLTNISGIQNFINISQAALKLDNLYSEVKKQEYINVSKELSKK